MIFRMPRTPLALLPLAATVLAGPAAAQSLVAFDNFDASTAISPTRWFGEEGRANGAIRTEAQRAIVTGQLRLLSKGYGDNTGATGTGLVRNSVVFAKSSAITTIRSTVTVRSVSVGACSANTSPSVARARVFGFFFNAGTPQNGSNFNDVVAGIQVMRASNSTDAAGVLRVQAFVGQCSDDNCGTTTSLGSLDLGTVALNTPVQLQVGWNAAGNAFTFQRDAQALVSIPYTVSDAMAPATASKRLDVGAVLARCSGSRVAASATADFDDVQTNALPATAASLGYAPAHGAGEIVGDGS